MLSLLGERAQLTPLGACGCIPRDATFLRVVFGAALFLFHEGGVRTPFGYDQGHRNRA